MNTIQLSVNSYIISYTISINDCSVSSAPYVFDLMSKSVDMIYHTPLRPARGFSSLHKSYRISVHKAHCKETLPVPHRCSTPDPMDRNSQQASHDSHCYLFSRRTVTDLEYHYRLNLCSLLIFPRGSWILTTTQDQFLISFLQLFSFQYYYYTVWIYES